MMRYKFMFLALACGLIFFISGCGYRIGVRGMTHPQIHSVAIAPIRNNSLEPLASDILRMQLAGEFQRDGALKLKRLSTADCVVYANITSITNRTIDDASFDGGVTYIPDQFELTVKVDFKVIIPGSGTMLSEGTVTGRAKYRVLSDPAIARTSALKYACFHASQSIVSQTTEAW